jgi:hypothetical protein
VVAFTQAWVISAAYEVIVTSYKQVVSCSSSNDYQDFTTGVNMMKDLKIVPRPQVPGGFVYQGRLDVSSSLFLCACCNAMILTRAGFDAYYQWNDM